MPDVREWLDSGTKSAARIPTMLPILIRQARLGEPRTYGEIGREMGIHAMAVDDVAGLIGQTLARLGDSPDWANPPPPPLQAIIVNGTKRVPGPGCDKFLGDVWKAAQTPEQRRTLIRGIWAELQDYDFWSDVCAYLGIDTGAGAFDDLTQQARASKGRGGEGEEHRALKAYVAAHPEVVGLSRRHPLGEQEAPLPSGDSVDVLFAKGPRKFAVEVKSSISSDGDIARGIYQCVKYRAVLEAESAISVAPFAVQVALVVGKAVIAKNLDLARALGVQILPNIQVCKPAA